MNILYVMPIWLWLGVLALCLSVAIPAIIKLIRGWKNRGVLSRADRSLLVLNELQLEALWLSRSLGLFIEWAGKRPPLGQDQPAALKWTVKIIAEYNAELAKDVNAFVTHLERRTGRLNVALRNQKDNITGLDSILSMQKALWFEAMTEAGVNRDKL